MKETRYRFTIQGIALDETTASPFVILNDPENGITIPIQTGPSEASSIIVALEGIQPEHRNSHDLLSAMFVKHRFILQHLEVYRCFNEVYHGRIVYRKGVRRYRQEVSTSDGIILCIKFGAPIYFSPQAVREAAPNRRIIDDMTSGAAQLLYLEPSHHSLQLM